MEVILIEDVAKLGRVGDLVKVAGGFARNFLIPQRKAIAASVKNKSRLEHEKRLAGFRLKKVRAEAEALAQRIAGISVTIARRVGEQEKLFGSVSAADIASALGDEGIRIDRRKIVLEEPIRALGVFEVPVKLQAELTSVVKVWVVAQ